MAAATPEDRITRDARCLWRTGPFGTVVLAPGAPEPSTLTGSGSVVWDVLARPRTRPELALETASRCGVDVEQIAADLDRLVDALIDLGAVRPAA
jgi:hypothetical protein